MNARLSICVWCALPACLIGLVLAIFSWRFRN